MKQYYNRGVEARYLGPREWAQLTAKMEKTANVVCMGSKFPAKEAGADLENNREQA
jgi:hypothetical protein